MEAKILHESFLCKGPAVTGQWRRISDLGPATQRHYSLNVVSPPDTTQTLQLISFATLTGTPELKCTRSMTIAFTSNYVCPAVRPNLRIYQLQILI